MALELRRERALPRALFVWIALAWLACACTELGSGEARDASAGDNASDACVAASCDGDAAAQEGAPDAGGDGDGDGDGDGEGDAGGQDGGPVECTARDSLDLLLVIDASASMTEERLQLAGQLQDLIRGLLSGDVDGDGTAESAGFRSVHVGAITSDLGAGSTDPSFRPIPSCTIPGNDASLIAYGDPTQVGCAASYSPPFVNAVPASGVSEVAARDLECMIRAVPSLGCGFEHPLEAALKALSTRSEPWRFLWTDAQGDRANEGFLRQDAMLAVLVISDEDDCSQIDIDLARIDSTRFKDVPMNARCGLEPEALAPLARYYHGLRGLKERPSDVVFGAIAGVPQELVEERGEGVYQRALEDARMDIRLDATGTNIENACAFENGQGATPARRLVELADMFGERGVAQSMCAPDIRDTLRAFASVVGQASSDPDCATDACPCRAPFECVAGRCTCEAQVSCPSGACDPVPDGCGGARDCGGCVGTLLCGGDGVANECGNTSECAEGHVCATLSVPQVTSATVWFFPNELPSSGVPDISARVESGVFATPAVDALPGAYRVDLDLSAYDTDLVSQAHLMIVLGNHDLATTPVASGDHYYMFPRRLRFGDGWVVSTSYDQTRLLPISADDPATVGHDGEGVVECAAEPCAGSCCNNFECHGACADGISIGCDGPEDCSGQTCCFDGVYSYCTSACTETVLCHETADCTSGTCNASGQGYGRCGP